MSLYEATLCELAARSSFASTTYSWSSMSAPESSGATLEITLLDSSTLAGQVELALKPRLLDQVRDCLRRRHYSLRTEKVYVGWIRRYVLFHDRRGKQ